MEIDTSKKLEKSIKNFQDYSCSPIFEFTLVYIKINLSALLLSQPNPLRLKSFF